MAFAPGRDADDFREANAWAIVQTVTGQEEKWRTHGRTVSSTHQPRPTRLVGMEPRRGAQRAADQPHGVRPKSRRVDREGTRMSEVRERYGKDRFQFERPVR